MSDTRVHIFGIRHHGPGSARSLQRALDELHPDCILIEGPPDADGDLALAGHPEMQPPVALLIYVPDEPQRAAFYPFACFSPEWVAMRCGLARQVPVRFMDLPQWHQLANESQADDSPPGNDPQDDAAPAMRVDPIGELARAAGYSDGERWWDTLIENRRVGHVEIFREIADAMTTLRGEFPTTDAREQQREAWMRRTLRAALKEGHERIAVVCGAWHAPALQEAGATGQAKVDDALLKGLAKVKTQAAWVPWSYDRLSYRSGYGAGIVSPEWYELLWSDRPHPAVEWMTRAARLMRSQDLDASSAQVIDAVRLSESLAGMRDYPLPGLEELDAAACAVLCFGNDAPMQLIRRKLVVGDRLGATPPDAPMIPLQKDLARLQKELRLPVSADEKDYALDLRKPMDLQRSHLLHRLALINLHWGELQRTTGKKGTFHEAWRVQWRPEFALAIIEAGRWGNTVDAAATALTRHAAQEAKDSLALAQLLDSALQADLPEAVADLVAGIQERTAVSSDIPQLMSLVPPLANVSRYGNVRQTDTAVVLSVVKGLTLRICIGLPAACSSLDDEAAGKLLECIIRMNDAVLLLQQEELLEAWRTALAHLAQRSDLHGLVSGRAVRILHESAAWEAEQTERQVSLALSTGNLPTHSAAWLEGFLTGSGLLLVHGDALWSPIDHWVRELHPDAFTQVLPLLRRTFSTFSVPERRQMAERVKSGNTGTGRREAATLEGFDQERAEAVLPLLAMILGADRPASEP